MRRAPYEPVPRSAADPAEKLRTDIVLVTLMPGVGANFGVSLVLDFT